MTCCHKCVVFGTQTLPGTGATGTWLHVHQSAAEAGKFGCGGCVLAY